MVAPEDKLRPPKKIYASMLLEVLKRFVNLLDRGRRVAHRRCHRPSERSK